MTEHLAEVPLRALTHIEHEIAVGDDALEQVLADIAGRVDDGSELGNPYLALWTQCPGQIHGRDARRLWADGVTVAVRVREHATSIFAWAVPDEPALAAIADHSPRGVVEVGAGTGYWARMLLDRGVDVAAYDLHPYGCDCGADDGWCNGRNRKRVQWSPVSKAGPEVAAAWPDRTLLLVWPPFDSPMGAEAIRHYADAGGQTVIHVGEGAGGCTGDQAMHRLLGVEGDDCELCDHLKRCNGVHTGGVLQLPCWRPDAHSHDRHTCGYAAMLPLFHPVATMPVAQWAGLNDSLQIFERSYPALPAARGDV